MKIEVIKLGSPCRDKATGLKGAVTHWLYDMGHRIDYVFQPKGLNEETGQPVDILVLEAERLEISPKCFELAEIDEDILGSQVTDEMTGFKGMAVGFVRHTHGCFHVQIQPKGRLPKSNDPVKKREFDLRFCTGKKIKKMKPDELEKSTKEKPSPTGNVFKSERISSTNILNR